MQHRGQSNSHVPLFRRSAREQTHHFQGSKQTWDLISAFLIVSLPMSLLSVALLVVVFAFRVYPSPSSVLNSDATGDDISAFYVRLSPASIALVASFSSTVAPFLMGSTITLVLYPLSSVIVKQTAEQRFESLPTPLQLGVLINLRNGNVMSLWPWLKGCLTRKGRHPTIHCLKCVTTVALLAALLSYWPCKRKPEQKSLDQFG